MAFDTTPSLRLLWTESGNGVALFLQDKPWAFFHESKNHGFSKGILTSTVGNPWNEQLFQATFGA